MISQQTSLQVRVIPIIHDVPKSAIELHEFTCITKEELTGVPRIRGGCLSHRPRLRARLG